MTPEERKSKVKELRDYFGNVFMELHEPNAYYAAKIAYTPKGYDGKYIGMFESELNKGDDVYIEIVDANYIPVDSNRKLYVLKNNQNWYKDYPLKTTSSNDIQRLVSVDLLKPVEVLYMFKDKSEQVKTHPMTLSDCFKEVSFMSKVKYEGKCFDVSVTKVHDEPYELELVGKTGKGGFVIRGVEEIKELIKFLKFIDNAK